MINLPNDLYPEVFNYLNLPTILTFARVSQKSARMVKSYLPVNKELLRHYLAVLTHLKPSGEGFVIANILWFKDLNVKVLKPPSSHYLYFVGIQSVNMKVFKEDLPKAALVKKPDGTFYVRQTDQAAVMAKYGKPAPTGKPIPKEFSVFVDWIQKRNFKDL